MTKLPRLSGKELCKIVEKLGFKFIRQTGSHVVYEHQDGRRVVIPVHSREELGPGLLTKIIKHDLQMTREEFLNQV